MRLHARRTDRRTARRRTALALAWALAVGAGTALPPAVRGQSACETAVVTAPVAGARLSGTVRVLGSAQIDRFLFYKLEWARADNPETWFATSNVIEAPVRHGLLDRWDTTGAGPGAYRLKLTVVDADSQERCRFTVERLTVAETADADADATPTGLPSPLPTAVDAARATAPEPLAPTAPQPAGEATGELPTARASEDDAATSEPSTAMATSEGLVDGTDAPAPDGLTEADDVADVGAQEGDADVADGLDVPADGGGSNATDAGDAPESDEGPEATGSEAAAAVAIADVVSQGFLLGFGVAAALMLLAVALWARSARR